MAFTENERKSFEIDCDIVQSRINKIKDNPMLLPFPVEEYPHIWNRLEQLAVMPREETIQALEADYVLLSDDVYKSSVRNGSWAPYKETEDDPANPDEYEQLPFAENERKSFEIEYDYTRWKIDKIKENPTLLVDLSITEYPHIWKRLEQLAAMTREELMNEIEADYAIRTPTELRKYCTALAETPQDDRPLLSLDEVRMLCDKMVSND